MRITSGIYKNKKIEFPLDKSSSVRPSKSMVREAMLSMLANHADFASSNCFDLFSGSGVLGIEALSREMKHVTFVDLDTSWIKKNLINTGVPEDKYKVIRQGVERFIPIEPAHIIIADAPYRQGLTDQALKRRDILGKTGTIWVIEVEKHFDITETMTDNFEILRDKKYGNSRLVLMRQL